jgi:hypothetical protein
MSYRMFRLTSCQTVNEPNAVHDIELRLQHALLIALLIEPALEFMALCSVRS